MPHLARQQGDTTAEEPCEVPSVTVVIPMHNVEDYLPDTLNSLQSQTLEDWECLCINDGSSDGSADVVYLYASRDTRLRLISQPYSGAAVARNRGLSEARGDYLLFLEGSDILVPTALEYCLARMRADQSELCVFEVEAFCSDSRDEEPGAKLFAPKESQDTLVFPRVCPDEAFLQIPPVAPRRMMYRVSFLHEHGLRFPTELRGGDELAFHALCVALARSISCVAQALYRSRRVVPGGAPFIRGNAAARCFSADAGQLIWENLLSYGLLSTFGVGALQLVLSHALGEQDTLKASPRCWIAARHLRSFVETSMAELQSLGITQTPQQQGLIESRLSQYTRQSHRLAWRWLLRPFQRFVALSITLASHRPQP